MRSLQVVVPNSKLGQKIQNSFLLLGGNESPRRKRMGYSKDHNKITTVLLHRESPKPP